MGVEKKKKKKKKKEEEQNRRMRPILTIIFLGCRQLVVKIEATYPS